MDIAHYIFLFGVMIFSYLYYNKRKECEYLKERNKIYSDTLDEIAQQETERNEQLDMYED